MTDKQSRPMTAVPLPCPFCGTEDISLWTGFGTQADISCQSCGCERNVQVADMREDGEEYPTFDEKTFRYPEWLITRTNNYLLAEWNTRSAAPAPGDVAEIVRELRAMMPRSFGPEGLYKLIERAADALARSSAETARWKASSEKTEALRINAVIEADRLFALAEAADARLAEADGGLQLLALAAKANDPMSEIVWRIEDIRRLLNRPVE